MMEILKAYVAGCFSAYLSFWLFDAYDHVIKMKKYHKECDKWKERKGCADEIPKYPSFFYEINTEFFVVMFITMLCSWFGVAFLMYAFVSYYKENL